MASSDTQSALPQISPEQPTNGPYLVNQDDYAAALLSSIQTAAIANMNHLLATDTGRITAVRTIILGSTLHAMHGLPSAVAQFGSPMYTASDFHESQAIIGFITIDSSPVFLADNWQWISETAIHTNTGRRNLMLTLLMRSPLACNIWRL